MELREDYRIRVGRSSLLGAARSTRSTRVKSPSASFPTSWEGTATKRRDPTHAASMRELAVSFIRVRLRGVTTLLAFGRAIFWDYFPQKRDAQISVGAMASVCHTVRLSWAADEAGCLKGVPEGLPSSARPVTTIVASDSWHNITGQYV